MEIVVNAADAALANIESRDEIEDVLEEALSSSALGEVTGGGGGQGTYIIDVELDEERFDEALDFLISVLRSLRLPPSTRAKRHEPTEVAYTLD